MVEPARRVERVPTLKENHHSGEHAILLQESRDVLCKLGAILGRRNHVRYEPEVCAHRTEAFGHSEALFAELLFLPETMLQERGEGWAEGSDDDGAAERRK